MKTLLALSLLAAVVLWRCSRGSQAERMSRAWLKQQREEGRVSYDGVSIRWPINKVANAQGWRNRQQERQRQQRG